MTNNHCPSSVDYLCLNECKKQNVVSVERVVLQDMASVPIDLDSSLLSGLIQWPTSRQRSWPYDWAALSRLYPYFYVLFAEGQASNIMIIPRKCRIAVSVRYKSSVCGQEIKRDYKTISTWIHREWFSPLQEQCRCNIHQSRLSGQPPTSDLRCASLGVFVANTFKPEATNSADGFGHVHRVVGHVGTVILTGLTVDWRDSTGGKARLQVQLSDSKQEAKILLFCRIQSSVGF